MGKLEFKQKILNHCINVLNERANTAKLAMDELQQTANDYGLPRDRYDSFRNQLLRKRDLHAEQYQKAIDEIKLLEKIKVTEINNQVQFGSVVKTNKQIMFISVSLGKIEIEENTIYAVSPQVPIFNVMKDLKTGDSFKFNNNTFKIVDLF